MDTLIHADIFFFVTTISVALITVLFIVAWIYGIKILANIHHLSKRARTEGGYIIDELGYARERIISQGFGVRVIFRMLCRIFSRYY